MSQLTCGHIQHMYSWWWVRLSPETCRVKAIAENKKRNCCILLDLFHILWVQIIAKFGVLLSPCSLEKLSFLLCGKVILCFFFNISQSESVGFYTGVRWKENNRAWLYIRWIEEMLCVCVCVSVSEWVFGWSRGESGKGDWQNVRMRC